MIIVISKRYTDYKEYLRKNSLTPMDATFANKRERLLGYENVEIVELGEKIKELQPYIQLIREKQHGGMDKAKVIYENI